MTATHEEIEAIRLRQMIEKGCDLIQEGKAQLTIEVVSRDVRVVVADEGGIAVREWGVGIGAESTAAASHETPHEWLARLCAQQTREADERKVAAATAAAEAEAAAQRKAERDQLSAKGDSLAEREWLTSWQDASPDDIERTLDPHTGKRELRWRGYLLPFTNPWARPKSDQ